MLKIVKTFRKIVDQKSSMKILTKIKVAHIGNYLSLHVTDLNLHACYGFDRPMSETALEGLIDFEAFACAVEAAGKDATIDFEGDKLKVSGDVSILLDVDSENAKDFPEIESGFEFSPAVQLDFKLMPYVEKAASKDTTRPQLCQYLVSESHVVATDGHRMHRIGTDTGGGTALISCRAAALVKTAKPEFCLIWNGKKDRGLKEEVHFDGFKQKTRKVRDLRHQTEIECGAFTLYERTEGEEFPPYEQITPGSHDSVVEVDTKALIKALEIVKKMNGRDKLAPVIFRHDLGLWVLNKNRDGQILDAKVSGDFAKEIGFTVTYILDAIRKDQKITRIEFSGPLDPAVIRYPDSIAVIMPMRIG